VRGAHHGPVGGGLQAKGERRALRAPRFGIAVGLGWGASASVRVRRGGNSGGVGQEKRGNG
jgi:hypothetical protein